MKYSYFYLILAATAVDIILYIVSVKHWEKKAVKSFSRVVLLIITAHAFYGASLVIRNPPVKYFVHELKFIGIAFFSYGFYDMYMNLFEKQNFLKIKYKILLSIVPSISVLLAVTNDFHHLFRINLYTVENAYGSFIGVQSGPLFWLYILYSYLLYAAVISIIIRLFFKTPKIYRMQLGIMVFAAVATLIINFISISNLFFEDFGDATLISFTIAAVVQFYGLVLYKPVRMIRMARDMAVNEIKDPLLIFDYENNFLDANAPAKEAFDILEKETLSGFLAKLGLPDTDQKGPFMISDKWYSITRKKVYDKDGEFTASAILLSDITEIKLREQELEKLANHDYLTGIANRHAYMRELSKISNNDLPLSVVWLNISGMKQFNIQFGNDEGDNLIKKIASALTSLGDFAFCARIGGDEFAVLLKNTTEAEARQAIDGIKDALAEITLVSGLAVLHSNMENINIINKISMDNMNMNKLLAHSNKLRSEE